MSPSIIDSLNNITGNLVAATKDDQARISALQQKLSTSLAPQLATEQVSRSLNIASTDFYNKDAAAVIQTPKTAGTTKVFARDVPVASSLVAGAVPAWAMGASPSETQGPFISKDGREVYFDFYTVEKLIALYFQGQTTPAILFKASFQQKLGWIYNLQDGVTKGYTLAPGSVWINARLLNPAAPVGTYAGIKVKGGTVTLDVVPALTNNQLVIPATANITVALQNDQKADPAAANTSPYGKDARDASYSLPATFNFGLKSTGKTITAIGAAKATIYGQSIGFAWKSIQDLVYNPVLSCIGIPWTADATAFAINKCQSPYFHVEGKAPIQASWWTLPVAALDVANPIMADGNGGVVILCGKGLSASWTGMRDGTVACKMPSIIGAPSMLGVIDPVSNAAGASQRMDLWSAPDQKEPTIISLNFLKQAGLVYTSLSVGDEAILTGCDSDLEIDRPVKVDGMPFAVRGKACLVMLAANLAKRVIYLYDDNLIADNQDPKNPKPIKPVAIALQNALFTVSPVTGVLLYGKCDEKWTKVTAGSLFLSFGLYSYIPTLPDPYIANLKIFDRLYSQIKRTYVTGAPAASPTPLLLLLCAVLFKDNGTADDTIDTSFHFGDNASWNAAAKAPAAPTPTPTQTVTDLKVNSFSELFSQAPLTAAKVADAVTTDTVLKATAARVAATPIAATLKTNFTNVAPPAAAAVPPPPPPPPPATAVMEMMSTSRAPDYQSKWDDLHALQPDLFALLDVSSNANQLGVSYGAFGNGKMAMVRTTDMKETGDNVMQATNTVFPFVVEGMEVKASSMFVRVFTLPQVAWEPMRNLTDPTDTSTGPKLAMDPDKGMLYFADDGGPTRLLNNSSAPVSLAPIPRVNTLISDFKTNPQNYTISLSTLPFGLRTLSFISKNFVETVKPDINNLQPTFRTNLTGGMQLSLSAGDWGNGTKDVDHDSPMFPGLTLQVNNVLDGSGNATGWSTLGDTVTKIFNKEFFTEPLQLAAVAKDAVAALKATRGVPVSRIDLTGYGANTFSNWLSPGAAFAQTSQAEFEIMMGRTAHEVIQVKSVVYPWGIKVVRTITVYKTSSGYIYRTDSGWRAQSDGLFDFTYKYIPMNPPDPAHPDAKVLGPVPYEIHPGMCGGLFNIRNIKDAGDVAEFTAHTTIPKGATYIDGLHGKETTNDGTGNITLDVELSPVYFDADIEIPDAVQGHVKKRVVSKKILGYVQLSPPGVPITAQQHINLLKLQGGSIGADVDCIVDINGSAQKMRINRVDVNASVNASGQPAFVVALRGNVILPKLGSWSMVQHTVGTGDVTPLPDHTTVPLIREGILKTGTVIDPVVVTGKLIRIANPADLLRAVQPSTVNFGLLQNTGTQKALFLTPAFGNKLNQLLSKTPPIFSDAYRLMTGNGIFPNIGNADAGDYGKAVALLKSDGADVFTQSQTLLDAGKKVYQLLDVLGSEGVALKKLKSLKLDIPDFDVSLIDIQGLKIYVKYHTDGTGSKLNFDIDSQIDSWKGRMNNLSMVVDLGPMKELVTIKGNFNATSSAEAGYNGGDGEGLPTPELTFSKDLQPVIDILQILLDISGGDYADAMNKGLKIAMGNAGDVWDYKFQADKELPLVRFPPTDELYNSAQTPLKLEASLGVGVYFNAGLKVTIDPKQLLPTAGAYLKFHGGLSVMCVSVGVGSIFATGTVDLKIGCDTKGGPSLDLAFGFGVQLVASLPVVGDVSLTFMAGIKMHLDSGDIKVTAFLLFKGQAELLGGLVGITIMIEASGTIDRNSVTKQTTCIAEVTFAIDISIFLIIDISFSKSWSESKQIA